MNTEIDMKKLAELQHKKEAVFQELIMIEKSISKLLGGEEAQPKKKRLSRSEFKTLCS